jgi:hypothetical protein
VSDGSRAPTDHADAFIPFEIGPLPRPLQRFGTTFPRAIAEHYAALYAPLHGIVFDPFARPASAADALAAADRRVVARHAGMLGEWARRVLAAAPAEAELRAAFTAVRAEMDEDVPLETAMRALYSSRCPTCGGAVIVEAFLWDRDAPVPARKAFRCGGCGRGASALLVEPVDQHDIARATRADASGTRRRSLCARFGDEPAARAFAQSFVSLYTARNAAALELLLAALDTALPSGRAQAFLRLALLEPMLAGSRLNAVAGGVAPLRVERGRARLGTAAQEREINLWLEFERCWRELLQHVASAARQAPPRLGQAAAPLPDADVLPEGRAELVLFEVPTTDGFGGWDAAAAALLMGRTYALQRVDGRASARERVLRQVRSALLDARRASRPGAHAVAYVPNADAGLVAAVALAGSAAGYRLRHVLYQRDSLAGMSGERQAAVAICDFESGMPLVRDQRVIDAAAIEATIREGVRAAIEARGEPVDTDRAAVAALDALAREGFLSVLALARGGGMSELEVFLDHFRSALADAAKSGLMKIEHAGQNAYWLAATGHESSPLDDRVEWAVYSLLSTAREADTRALLRRTYALFRGIQTPDRELVLRCIASYGVQDEAGRWRLRAADALAARQEEQAAIVTELVQLARRLDFGAWIGRHLQRRPALTGLLTDAERRMQPPPIFRVASDALADLDCIWYDRRGMVFLWKIDWTARLHQSLVTFGEAVAEADRVFRFLVVPDERRDLIRLKFQRRPGLAGVAQQRGWRLVKYGPLRAFARQAEVDLYGLEPLIGLEPAVEQGGHQLVFHW